MALDIRHRLHTRPDPGVPALSSAARHVAGACGTPFPYAQRSRAWVERRLQIGTGEIFGGGIASVIAGRVEMTYGIEYSTHLAAIALVVGLVAPLSLNETAPAKVS